MRPGLQRRTWRTFDRRETAHIRARLEAGERATCPRCGTLLEAKPTTRMRAVLPGGARGHDLDCRECRRFFPDVWHTHRSLYHLRIRRIAAAVLNA